MPNAKAESTHCYLHSEAFLLWKNLHSKSSLLHSYSSYYPIFMMFQMMMLDELNDFRLFCFHPGMPPCFLHPVLVPVPFAMPVKTHPGRLRQSLHFEDQVLTLEANVKQNLEVWTPKKAEEFLEFQMFQHSVCLFLVSVSRFTITWQIPRVAGWNLRSRVKNSQQQDVEHMCCPQRDYFVFILSVDIRLCFCITVKRCCHCLVLCSFDGVYNHLLILTTQCAM